MLVIGEIGKNFSGAGIDPNVVGRLLMEVQPETYSPAITRIIALDLSVESHGNAVGVGIADLTTERLIAAIDAKPTRMNTLTSCSLCRSKIPLSYSTDRECLQIGLETCWQPIQDKLRVALIPNTLELAELWASPALVEEAKKHPHLKIEGAARPLPFDAQGNLRQEEMFPHSVRGRRTRSTNNR